MSNSDPQVSMREGDPGNANLIYILYLVSIVVGITGLIGVIMAYIGRDKADPVIRSHYTNQINIFWKSLLYMVISIVLMAVIIGIVLIFVALIWYIVRTVKGMQALSRGEAIAEPGRWGF